MALYHYQLGIPSQVKSRIPQGVIPLKYSDHARRAADTDKYGVACCLPSNLRTGASWLIEVETDEQGKVVKCLYRVGVSSDVHLCLAVLYSGGYGVVKTVWGQDANDEHKTLNESRYSH